MNPAASSSCTIGGTIRWMSPELLYPDQSGLGDSRPTKQSDCYALGMVIYEVLSGKVPFAPFNRYIVMRKVMEGERPERPEGTEGVWFTDDLWRMLNRCWAAKPKRRPHIAVVLRCLGRVSRALDSEAPSQQVGENVGMDEDGWDIASDSSGSFSRFGLLNFFGSLFRILC